VAPVYTNALQALKKFRAISIINFFGAPVRFFSMIVAMPYRALSGYFVGQASTPIFHIISSVFFLRRELSVKSDPYWTRQVVGRFLFLFVGIMMVYGTSTFCATVEQLIIRQRLPEVDSAAYYMLTRFADMSGFLSAALSITLFPYAGELASKGRSAVSLVLKCSLSMVVFGAALSMAFVWKGEWLLSILPSGELYAPFAKYIPWLIAINIMGAIVGFFTTAEISAGRFAFLRWWIPLHLIYVALMLMVTGHGYLNAILPGDIVDFIASFNITSIEIMIIWIGIATAIRLLFSVFALATDRRFSRTDPEAAVAEGV
jgi:O-antigen/teichoic acid export membrane protein